jgi:hypothetical protein
MTAAQRHHLSLHAPVACLCEFRGFLTAQTVMKDHEWWIGKDAEGSGCGLNHGIRLGILRKTIVNSSEHSQYPCQNSNRASAEYRCFLLKAKRTPYRETITFWRTRVVGIWGYPVDFGSEYELYYLNFLDVVSIPLSDVGTALRNRPLPLPAHIEFTGATSRSHSAILCGCASR